MWYICFCGSEGEFLLITYKVFQLQPFSLLLLLFTWKNRSKHCFILRRTKRVLGVRLCAECHNCICSKWQRLRWATWSTPAEMRGTSTHASNYRHTCKRLWKTVSFILRFLAALVVQRRFQISPRMIFFFTGVKATIPHDCTSSLLEQTAAPIVLCVKTFRGKMKITMSAAVQQWVTERWTML